MTDETPRKETLDPPLPLAAGKKAEINGFEALGLLEPTRYGDWDVKGRCSDF
ncbi:MAG: DUF1674 domain-containing protein [Alphaproteobacteria bacterium]